MNQDLGIGLKEQDSEPHHKKVIKKDKIRIMFSLSFKDQTCQRQPSSQDNSDSDDDSEFDKLLQFQAFSTSTGSSSSPANNNNHNHRHKKQKTGPNIQHDNFKHDVPDPKFVESITKNRNDLDAVGARDAISEQETCHVSHHKEDDNDLLRARAMKKALTSSVPDAIQHPNMLFWSKPSQNRSKNKSKRAGSNHYYEWYPCRTCSPDEVSGLNLPQNWDTTKKVLVQYLEGTGFSKRELILKNRLVPYHGKDSNMERNDDERIENAQQDGQECYSPIIEGDRNETQTFVWCPLAMEEMSNRNRKSRKKLFQDESNVLAMELYMKRVMDTAVERMKSNHQICSSPLTSKVNESKPNTQSVSSSSRNSNSVMVSQDIICENDPEHAQQDEEDDSDDDSNLLTPSPRAKETLRAGDVIAYYQPNMIFGDQRAYREARIDEIACKKELVLKLQGGDYLDRNQRVKRLEKMSRGNLVPCDESWIHLHNFRLQSGKIKGAKNTGIVEEAKRLKRSLDHNKEKMKEKLKSQGLDMFGNFLK